MPHFPSILEWLKAFCCLNGARRSIIYFNFDHIITQMPQYTSKLPCKVQYVIYIIQSHNVNKKYHHTSGFHNTYCKDVSTLDPSYSPIIMLLCPLLNHSMLLIKTCTQGFSHILSTSNSDFWLYQYELYTYFTWWLILFV